MNFKYSKQDKLKSKKLIEQLFTEGKSVTAYPLKLIYLKTEFEDDSILKTGVSVSKRLHKTAVDRNRIKRLLREAYRLNKPEEANCAFNFRVLIVNSQQRLYLHHLPFGES